MFLAGNVSPIYLNSQKRVTDGKKRAMSLG
jgi:hypothetical protein